MKDDKSSPADQPKAAHGTPSEVSWDGGAGRQPYANQGEEEAEEAGGGDEFPAGDRGELSGRTHEQLEAVRKTAWSDDVEQHQQHNDQDRNAE
jgi:hypothetical protein